MADSSQLGQTHEAFLPYILNVFLPFELTVHCDPEVPNTPHTSNVHSPMTNYEVVAHISLPIPTENH